MTKVTGSGKKETGLVCVGSSLNVALVIETKQLQELLWTNVLGGRNWPWKGQVLTSKWKLMYEKEGVGFLHYKTKVCNLQVMSSDLQTWDIGGSSAAGNVGVNLAAGGIVVRVMQLLDWEHGTGWEQWLGQQHGASKGNGG